MAEQELLLAGRSYRIDFRGFHQPLLVLHDGHPLSLAPWSFRQHMDSLRACTRATASGLQLDSQRLAAAVLADSAAGVELQPLALWWSAGGDGALPAVPASHEWLALEQGRARLQPWSTRARLTALASSLTGEEDERWFDPVQYLEQMVRASLLELDAPCGLDQLDSRSTAILLHACSSLNSPDPTDDLLLDGPLGRQQASRTLRLCQALGWTPGQVWSMPATEADRLERLLALTQPTATPAAAPVRQGLAGHPDAVVFDFE